MNRLSSMIYWADVLPGLSNGIAFILIILCIPFMLACIYYYTIGSETTFEYVVNEQGYRTNEEKLVPTRDALQALKFGWSRYALAASLVGALSMNFIPSKDTFYLIAASEAGEQALKTPEAAKIRAVINKWLDDTIKDEPETK
jgi:hypothetical protein